MTMDRSFIERNLASRERIRDLAGRLSDDELQHRVGEHWTVAIALAHLAFWDRRVLYVLDMTEREGKLFIPEIDIFVNDLSLPLWAAIPPRQAARLALAFNGRLPDPSGRPEEGALVRRYSPCDTWLRSLPRGRNGRPPLLPQKRSFRYRSRPRSLEEVEVAKASFKGKGTRKEPWILKTPPGTSEFSAFRDEALDPPALVVQVGKTELRYQLRCIDDLHSMLKTHGDWMLLGSADEQKDAAPGTVEAWGRSPKSPVKGWYGLKQGLRGRFAMYVPPVLEAMGLAEVEQ